MRGEDFISKLQPYLPLAVDRINMYTWTTTMLSGGNPSRQNWILWSQQEKVWHAMHAYSFRKGMKSSEPFVFKLGMTSSNVRTIRPSFRGRAFFSQLAAPTMTTPSAQVRYDDVLSDFTIHIPSHIFVVQWLYRVGQVVANLGWVDLDLGCSSIPLGQ